MRKFIFIFFAFYSTMAFSQSRDSPVQYASGFKELYRTLAKSLHIGDKDITSSALNRYYSVLLTINNSGKISGVSIVTLGAVDSSELPIILRSIKRTDGKWINHSGKNQVIVLPIYFIYYDNENENQQKMPDIHQDYYVDWTKTKLTYIEPSIIKVLPVVH